MSLYAGVITYLKGEILREYQWFAFLTGWKLITITGIGWILIGVFYQKSNKGEYWLRLKMVCHDGTSFFEKSHLR